MLSGAAELIFPFRLVVYQNGPLYTSVISTVTFSFGIATTAIYSIAIQSNFVEVLKNTRLKIKLMEGVTILVGGDFKETLRLIPKGSRAYDLRSYLKRSILLPQVNILKL